LGRGIGTGVFNNRGLIVRPRRWPLLGHAKRVDTPQILRRAVHRNRYPLWRLSSARIDLHHYVGDVIVTVRLLSKIVQRIVDATYDFTGAFVAIGPHDF